MTGLVFIVLGVGVAWFTAWWAWNTFEGYEKGQGKEGEKACSRCAWGSFKSHLGCRNPDLGKRYWTDLRAIKIIQPQMRDLRAGDGMCGKDAEHFKEM